MPSPSPAHQFCTFCSPVSQNNIPDQDILPAYRLRKFFFNFSTWEQLSPEFCFKEWKDFNIFTEYTMHKCGLCCRPVSVYPSITFMYCIESSVFSFKYHFSFSYRYRFSGIFVLVMTFLSVNVVRLMTTLSKVRKSHKQSLQCIFCCSTITKTGYTSVHSTLSSMHNVTVRFQKYPPAQGHLTTVPFSCCQITHHTARIIVQHRLERQETPRDPVPAETVSYSWTRDPTKTV